MIGVKVNNSLVDYTYDKRLFTVRESVYEWLLSHVGPGGREGGYSEGCSWLWCWETTDTRRLVFVFGDHNVAMLFKLTWGGDQSE